MTVFVSGSGLTYYAWSRKPQNGGAYEIVVGTGLLNVWGVRKFAIHLTRLKEDGPKEWRFWEFGCMPRREASTVTDPTILALLKNWTAGALIEPLLDAIQTEYPETADTIADVLQRDRDQNGGGL